MTDDATQYTEEEQDALKRRQAHIRNEQRRRHLGIPDYSQHDDELGRVLKLQDMRELKAKIELLRDLFDEIPRPTQPDVLDMLRSKAESYSITLNAMQKEIDDGIV